MQFTQDWTATIENRHNANKKICIMPSKLLRTQLGHDKCIYVIVEVSSVDLKIEMWELLNKEL